MTAGKGKRRNKKSYRDRIVSRAQGFATLGHDLATKPKSAPQILLRAMKRSAHSLWLARGGGFYAAGFVVSFIWLEVSMLFGDVMQATSIGAFFGGQILELLMRFTVESLKITVLAFLWPLAVAQLSPPWGIAILLLAYVIFTRFLKEWLGNWLFEGDEPGAADGEPDQASERTNRGQDEN